LFNVVKVNGDSMSPELTNGDFVIVSRFFRSLKVGDLVVADHPRYNSIVKRIVEVCERKGILLEGCNNSSVTSEQMGWIRRTLVSGKVRFKVRA